MMIDPIHAIIGGFISMMGATAVSVAKHYYVHRAGIVRANAEVIRANTDHQIRVMREERRDRPKLPVAVPCKRYE